MSSAIQSQGLFSFLSLPYCPASKGAGGYEELEANRTTTAVLSHPKGYSILCNIMWRKKKKKSWKKYENNDCMYNHYYFFFSSFILVFVNSVYLNPQILLQCFFLILSPSHWEAGVSKPLCGAELPAELNHNNDLSVSRMKDKYSLIHRSNSQQQAVSSTWSSSAFVFNEETCSVAHSQSENNKDIAAMS